MRDWDTDIFNLMLARAPKLRSVLRRENFDVLRELVTAGTISPVHSSEKFTSLPRKLRKLEKKKIVFFDKDCWRVNPAFRILFLECFFEMDGCI